MDYRLMKDVFDSAGILGILGSLIFLIFKIGGFVQRVDDHIENKTIHSKASVLQATGENLK